MKKTYLITVYCENKTGLIHRVIISFTKRRINIESFTAVETGVKDLFRLTLAVNSTKEKLEKVAQQIEKQIEVLGAFVHDQEEVIYRELALYKVPTKYFRPRDAEKIAKVEDAKIISSNSDYVVFEKSGTTEEIQAFLKKLNRVGVTEFSGSGKIVVLQSSKNPIPDEAFSEQTELLN